MAPQNPLNDICNADEFRINYIAAPTWKLGLDFLARKQMSQSRSAFMTCADVDVTDIFIPLIICKRYNQDAMMERVVLP